MKTEQERRGRALKRRLREYHFIDDIIAADRGNTAALREYLLSDLPLSQE